MTGRKQADPAVHGTVGLRVRLWHPRGRTSEGILLRSCGNFHFVDNTFNLPPSYAKDLCRKLIDAELGLDWWGIIYPKWVDGELSELMAKAGCTQVSLGFESGSETMLPQLNKRFTGREVREISDTLAAVGVQCYGFLLLGGPGETRETVEESLEFADSLRLDALKITVGLRIYPQTPLASSALADGALSDPMTTCLCPSSTLPRACGTGCLTALPAENPVGHNEDSKSTFDVTEVAFKLLKLWFSARHP